VSFLSHDEAVIRSATAEAVAAALAKHPDYMPSTLDLVLDLYFEHLKVTVCNILAGTATSQKLPPPPRTV